MAKYTDETTGHVYDGIGELDNDMPSWWLYLFYVSIVFSVIYMFFYHFSGTGLSSSEKYLKQTDPNWVRASHSESALKYHSPYYSADGDITPQLLKKLGNFVGEDVSFATLIQEALRRASDEQRELLESSFPDIGSMTIAASQSSGHEESDYSDVELLTDTESLDIGKKIYVDYCVACHGVFGEGTIGPNMTDNYWIHGGSTADIVRIINVGVPAKGMLPWNRTLKPLEIQQVTSYIHTLIGTDPPNGKAPQGELYTP